MRYYRVVFQNLLTGEMDSEDVLGYSAQDATDIWKSNRTPLDCKNLEWCGSFLTPSRLFLVEDFS